MNLHGWFPLVLMCLISLQPKESSRVFSSTIMGKWNWKHSFFSNQPIWSNSHSHPYMTTGKNIAITIQTFVQKKKKMMFLLFNMLSRFVIAFLPGSKRFLISWLWSPSSVIYEPKKRKSVIASTISPSICLEVMGLMPLLYMPAFSLLFHPYQEAL